MVDGYHFDMQGRPSLHAIQAAACERRGHRPARAQGRIRALVRRALAHAIFFHSGSLDYFHTHVCSPSTPNCSSVLGGARIAGHASAPGKLTLGVLLPVPGTWRLFLQMRVGSRILTAPYTLKVGA